MNVCVECGEVLLAEDGDTPLSEPHSSPPSPSPDAVRHGSAALCNAMAPRGHLSGAPSALYVDYGEGTIRLVRCKSCGNVADKYIEQELALLCIDIVLHREAAFRHLFFNRRPLFFGISPIEMLLLVISASLLLKLSSLYDLEHFRSAYASRPWSSAASLVASCLAEHIAFALPLMLGLGALDTVSSNRKKGSLSGLRLYYAIAFAEVGKLFALFLRVWEAGPEVLFLLAVLMMSLQAASVRVCAPLPELRHRLLPAMLVAVVCRLVARLSFHSVSDSVAMGTVL